jgi:hypothetical protein
MKRKRRQKVYAYTLYVEAEGLPFIRRYKYLRAACTAAVIIRNSGHYAMVYTVAGQIPPEILNNADRVFKTLSPHDGKPLHI